jgi:hypothetical protein
MVFREHPQGAVPLVGRELRYLVESDHGFLGGMAFSAATLQLEERDKWIGWDVETRCIHLQHVIAMSRFLLRPKVRCQNLVPLLLGEVLCMVPNDFEKRYGLRPWLVESFVDSSFGIDFLEANWVHLGQMKGRNSIGRVQKTGLPANIYIYPLEKEFQSLLGLLPDNGPAVLKVTDGLSEETWAENEFGGAQLGDKRLSKRLVASAETASTMPGRAFCGVTNADWPAVQGYYRLIDRPDQSAVTMENIIKPHRERTIGRMRGQETVLAIQDGCSLDYSNLSVCEGLGVIGSNQTGVQSMGLHLHSTFVVTPSGLPLGVLRAECEARQPKSAEDKRLAADIPIEEKKSIDWIKSLRDLTKVAREMPDTLVISVTDREADFYELFDEHRNNTCNNLHMLVRAKHNRSINGGGKLFDTVKESPVCGEFILPVERKSARPKKSKQKASAKRSGREAKVSLRYKTVELLAPKSDNTNRPPITVTIVHVVEENPPEGEKGIEWFLLTTVDVQNAGEAEECLRWYCKRWRIEDWHRVLKSGCRIEEAAHKTAERLKRSIAINLVIAWRIMLMTLLGRETPELPVEVMFSDVEIKILKAFAKKRKLDTPDQLQLGTAVQLVARLGGYLARKNDPPPGHQVMWHGHTVLGNMCEGYALMC